MNVIQFFSLPSIQALGWSLVHSLWQGLVCIVVALVVLRCLPSKWSSARYAVATVTLLVIFLSSLTTFIYLNDSFERAPIESTTQGYYAYPVENLQQENNYFTDLLLIVQVYASAVPPVYRPLLGHWYSAIRHQVVRRLANNKKTQSFRYLRG